MTLKQPLELSALSCSLGTAAFKHFSAAIDHKFLLKLCRKAKEHHQEEKIPVGEEQEQYNDKSLEESFNSDIMRENQSESVWVLMSYLTSKSFYNLSEISHPNYYFFLYSKMKQFMHFILLRHISRFVFL